MAKILISVNNNKLKRYLAQSHDHYCYLIAGNENEKLPNVLKEERFTEIRKKDYSKSQKEAFCESYVEFVGRLGVQFNSRDWWMTFTSSKNRFESGLLEKLQVFNYIVNVMKEQKDSNILIINPDVSICQALIKMLKNENREYILLRSILGEVCSKLYIGLTSLLRKIIIIANFCKRKYIAKRYLRKCLQARLSAGSSYYVIKTFIYKRCFDLEGNYQDDFFKQLPKYLIKQGKNVIILGNVVNNYAKIVKLISKGSNYIIIPQEYLLSYFDIMKIAFCCLRKRLKLKKGVYFLGGDVSDLVITELADDYRDGSIYYQYDHYLYIKRLCQLININTFVHTYENNPWEKMCLSALKKYSPATRIIGYQHTVVPQASANMFLSEHDADIAPLPDRILTVGAIPKKIIERYGFYKNIPVEEACALRFEYLESLPVGPRAKKRKILLGLEGVQKVYKLVNYVLQECENVKDLEIVIRDHPVLPFRNLQRDVKYDIDNMANVSLSKNLSVKDDVESADIVIYWGSSVALEASMMGKPVIHFDSGTVLSYDPLFENTALKWTVTEKDRLLDIIDSIYALSDEEFCLQQQKARQYLRNYFYPVTENGLQKFVN